MLSAIRVLTGVLSVLFSLVLALPVLAQDPDTGGFDREQVLQAIGHEDPDIRSGAYIALGDVGIHDDLPLLYSALYDNDHLIRRIAEGAIWKIWGRSGNTLHDQIYLRGLQLMNAGRFAGSVQSFSALINLAPDFAEAWNKRATVYYLMGEDDLSIADCEEVLAREPNHFGALSGYALLMLRRHDYRSALMYFEKALTVNPNLRGVPENIEAIKRMLEAEGGDAV